MPLPQLDWELAESITARLLAAAPEITISYAQQKEGLETRPSRLVASIAGTPRPLPSELAPDAAKKPRTVVYEDRERIPAPAAPAILPAVHLKKSTAQLSLFDDGAAQPAAMQVHKMPGGSNVLTAQAQCPFKAFATGRLAARTWEPRGDRTDGKPSAASFCTPRCTPYGPALPTQHSYFAWNFSRSRTGCRTFVAPHVQRAIAENAPPRTREEMPSRYLELEPIVSLRPHWRVAPLRTNTCDFDGQRHGNRTPRLPG